MGKELNLNDPDPLVATLAQLFASSGAAREVAVLTVAEASLVQIDYDNWDGGLFVHCLYLAIPATLYSQIEPDIESCESAILERAQPLLGAYRKDNLRQVSITPSLEAHENWRDKAKAWLAGPGITNQGRVRSDNIASRECDGLLFRSQPEINLYKALKSKGVSFAPLPVFIRGGETYRRIEPDFVILKNGLVMVVEVDGDTVHTESPREAHDRTTMLAYEGAHIERVGASECDTPELAKNCASKLIAVIEKMKSNK